MKRKGYHSFEMEEKSVHSVDRALFEIAISFGDVIASEKHSSMFNEEGAESFGDLRWGEIFGGERECILFDVMCYSAGPGCEGVKEITFGSSLGFIFRRR